MSRAITVSEPMSQDKASEIAVFSEYAHGGEFNLLTDRSSQRLISRCLAMAGLRPAARVWDLGCGSGAFTALLQEAGLDVVGLDLCHPLTVAGRRRRAGMRFVVGDVERLPVRAGSLDGVLLSGLVHHLPDPRALAREVFRVLRPGGVFMAFDPNRRNPFMWLYRDHDSPWYSPLGVSPNERPVRAEDVTRVFRDAGFAVRTEFLSPAYRTIASRALRWALPVYNAFEAAVFAPSPLRGYRAFVLTAGIKPAAEGTHG